MWYVSAREFFKVSRQSEVVIILVGSTLSHEQSLFIIVVVLVVSTLLLSLLSHLMNLEYTPIYDSVERRVKLLSFVIFVASTLLQASFSQWCVVCPLYNLSLLSHHSSSHLSCQVSSNTNSVSLVLSSLITERFTLLLLLLRSHLMMLSIKHTKKSCLCGVKLLSN